jgi:protein SCO1/2
MSRIALLLISPFVFLSCTEKKQPLPYYNVADFTPIFVTNSATKEKVTHRIADFNFTDQHGAAFSSKDIDNRIHVANFFFSRCGTICPKMTNNLLAVQDAFGNDAEVKILSYTVTPWQDSVPALQGFADRYGITSPNWHLLTGNTADIYQLARESYFAERDIGLTKDSTEFLHTEHILLVDKDRKLRGIYNGTLQLEISQLIADIKSLKAE